jgi:hypothetical protein
MPAVGRAWYWMRPYIFGGCAAIILDVTSLCFSSWYFGFLSSRYGAVLIGGFHGLSCNKRKMKKFLVRKEKRKYVLYHMGYI